MAIIYVHGLFIFFLYVFLMMVLPTGASSSDSEALLRLKQSFVDAASLDSWKPGTEPCAEDQQWLGVICDDGAVFALRLENLSLSGKIDVEALVSLSGLRSISFMSNAFSGPIPDFPRVGVLRGLYLAGNGFSGEIPADYFSRMEGLKKVWLSGNKFSGPIPTSLVQLSQLIELHLENNQFSGAIPAFGQQSLTSLNLSNNNLEGEIPTSLSRFSLHAFEGNAGLCGGSTGKTCAPPEAPPIEPQKKGGLKLGVRILIGCIVAFVIVLLLIGAVVFVMRRRKKPSNTPIKENVGDDGPVTSTTTASIVGKKDPENSSKRGAGVGNRAGSSRKGSARVKKADDLVLINDKKGQIGMADLMKAAAEVLGAGALGSSYKAVMASGFAVVVKRIKEMNKVEKEQFAAEMRRLGGLNHKNLLTPLAYHYRKEEKLLVYEYQPKGSLLFRLHGDRGTSHAELNWPTRFKIIQGIARGLEYLHTELSSLVVPHGDLKSSNVLLTPEYEPLLADYGFCTLTSTSQAAQALTAYKAPEVTLDQNQISPKCDVFCLGIMILEILSGKYPSQYLTNGQGGTDLVQWVRSAIAEGREADLVDPDIADQATSCIGEMKQLLHIGSACTESDPGARLDLREAIRRLEAINVDRSYQDKA